MIIEIIISHIDFYVIERLRELRVRSTPYIDQVELAQRIGVSEGYLGQIENPKSRAKYNMRMLSRAAKALGLKSYQDILPTEVLKDDMVKIRLKLLKSDTKKHEVDETGNKIKVCFSELICVLFSLVARLYNDIVCIIIYYYYFVRIQTSYGATNRFA